MDNATKYAPLAFEQNKLNNPGESRTDHFNAAAQRATMAGVIGSRKADQDDLTFGNGPAGDD